ncbi:hypothetical protein D3C80_1488090 [compost metagenome]
MMNDVPPIIFTGTEQGGDTDGFLAIDQGIHKWGETAVTRQKRVVKNDEFFGWMMNQPPP